MNIEYVPTEGVVILDPKDNLIAIDNVECLNGGLVYLGNNPDGEPEFKDELHNG